MQSCAVQESAIVLDAPEPSAIFFLLAGCAALIAARGVIGKRNSGFKVILEAVHKLVHKCSPILPNEADGCRPPHA
jgi:hypothetical protein